MGERTQKGLLGGFNKKRLSRTEHSLPTYTDVQKPADLQHVREKEKKKKLLSACLP